MLWKVVEPYLLLCKQPRFTLFGSRQHLTPWTARNFHLSS